MRKFLRSPVPANNRNPLNGPNVLSFFLQIFREVGYALWIDAFDEFRERVPYFRFTGWKIF